MKNMKKWIASIVASAATHAFAQPAEPRAAPKPPESRTGSRTAAPSRWPTRTLRPVYATRPRQQILTCCRSASRVAVRDRRRLVARQDREGVGWVLTKSSRTPRRRSVRGQAGAPALRRSRRGHPIRASRCRRCGRRRPAGCCRRRCCTRAPASIPAVACRAISASASATSRSSACRRPIRFAAGPTPTAVAKAIQPYVTATFRMGVGEDRLFEGQPGLVSGFASRSSAASRITRPGSPS